MSYATVSWRWRGREFAATWKDRKLDAAPVAKLLLEEWDKRARGMDVSGFAEVGPLRNHLTTIPSFLGLVRWFADEVLDVQTDNDDNLPPLDPGAVY